MGVRLKFWVNSKSEVVSFPGTEKSGSVRLSPVTSGSDENKQFYKWTPSGAIEFATINEAALAELPLGAEVYIDITVVPKEAPAGEPFGDLVRT